MYRAMLWPPVTLFCQAPWMFTALVISDFAKLGGWSLGGTKQRRLRWHHLGHYGSVASGDCDGSSCGNCIESLMSRQLSFDCWVHFKHCKVKWNLNDLKDLANMVVEEDVQSPGGVWPLVGCMSSVRAQHHFPWKHFVHIQIWVLCKQNTKSLGEHAYRTGDEKRAWCCWCDDD